MSLRSSIATAALLTLLGTSCGWAEPLGVATAFDGAYRVDLGNRQATGLVPAPGVAYDTLPALSRR